MPTMKIEVDITKPPKEEAARIEKLLTELQLDNKDESSDIELKENPVLELFGLLKGQFAGQDTVELQRKWRSEWE